MMKLFHNPHLFTKKEKRSKKERKTAAALSYLHYESTILVLGYLLM